MKQPNAVQLKEVGPRDGLQNEKTIITTENKIELINRLSDTGLDYIEVSSFVHPKWIPQLADAVDVLKGIDRKPGITYAALVPNLKGLERALDADIDEVSVFMSASEGHNKENINKTIAETFPVLREVVQAARAAGKTVRGYISTVVACPYDGYTEPSQVKYVADHLFDMGVQEISLGDTIGVAVPTQVERLLDELLKHYKPEHLAMHFHDTHGTAISNIVASLPYGITRFDSAIGGLGGCPYAKGASGNVATEDVLYLFDTMGIETSVDMQKLLHASQFMEQQMKRPLTSKQMAVFRGEQL